MKELITEEQANFYILILSIAVFFLSVGFGLLQSPKAKKEEKKILWLNSALCALVGPVIWMFWLVYNSIENYYGLDSLKALKINFLIAVALGAVFFALFTYAPRWVQETPAARRKK